MIIPTLSELANKGQSPEIVFWVGCAGSFDNAAQKVTKALAKILVKANVNVAILGTEESCTGDPAKRAGNEFLFQMQALQVIDLLNSHQIKKIVTACPHCFNTLKNEYPELGGNYNVIHHTQLLYDLLEEGKITLEGGQFKGKRIVYHDPCYLGRANDSYEIPRKLLKKLDIELVEIKNNKSKSTCCGAGGAQMFKESEKGAEEINTKRVNEVLEKNPSVIATGCPFCKIMLKDGLKSVQKEHIETLDIVELILNEKK